MIAGTDPVEVFLMPGDHFAGDARHRVSTILGSCVSVTLWHPGRRVGAISHFVLPGASTRGGRPRSGHLAEDAFTLMLQDLERLGVPVGGCEAKVFGGAEMFDPRAIRGGFDVGRRNGEAALALLKGLGLRVVAQSLFDAGHRRIRLDMSTGEVWVRHDRPEGSPAAPKWGMP